jgi:LuxR family maltose regulon positive regulatory protein
VQKGKVVVTPRLQTKLEIPPPRSKTVARPGLLNQIDSSTLQKLTLISAPAGFGKTTLLQTWFHKNKGKVTWFSIDERDNDPIRFWFYFVASLQHTHAEIGQGFLAGLQSSASPEIENLLIKLINEISIGSKVIMIVDDYHLIIEKAIHNDLFFFLENAPPNYHLLLSSRIDPPWPLARLRARQELSEIRADTLRFTHQEIHALFNKIMGLNISAEDSTKLTNRTEGWIAGLQMAALSLQGRKNIQERIQDFSGSNRHIFDYLVEEIFANQTPEITDFLIKTSILNRLSAPLCNEILGITNSSEILTYLDQANIFINPLDDRRQWYSYHGLFRDLLYMQLEINYPTEIPNLHIRASQWLANHEQLYEATNHAIQSSNHDQFAKIAEGRALSLVQQRELLQLQHWLDKLPMDVIRTRPWLAIVYAWVLVNTIQLEDLEKWLAVIGSFDPQNKDEKEHYLGHEYAIRSYEQGQRGNGILAIEFAEKALSYLPKHDSARGWAATTLAHCYRKLGDLTSAEQAYIGAIQEYEAIKNDREQSYALIGLANIQLIRGKLQEAEISYRTILENIEYQTKIGSWIPITGYVHSALGSILLEKNKIKTAEQHTRLGLSLSKKWGQLDYLFFSFVQHINVLLALQEIDEAHQIIQKIDRYLFKIHDWPYKMMSSYKIRFYLIVGETETAAEIAHQCGFHESDPIEYEYILIYTALVRLLIAEREYKKAQQLLEKLLGICNSAGAVQYTVEIMVLQSITFDKNGEAEFAESTLQNAIKIAEASGYIRTIIGEGENIRSLLLRVAHRSARDSYARKLLATMEKEDQPRMDEHRRILVESLTPKECEILQLLTTNLSIPEIADQLVISANTVRTHVKHIYDKLGVNRRRSAVQKAKQLNLV